MTEIHYKPALFGPLFEHAVDKVNIEYHQNPDDPQLLAVLENLCKDFLELVIQSKAREI